MSDKRTRPSVVRIVWTDYLCLILSLTPVILLMITAGLAWKGEVDFRVLLSRMSSLQFDQVGHEGVFIAVVVLLVVACPPCLVLRIGGIRRLFVEGVEASAKVVNVFHFRDRGRIEVEFEHKGEMFRVGNAVHLSAPSRSIREGQTVTVLFREDNPKKALIKEIYL